tara:strand:+ start:3049 stop:3342 length:294 start_codon:yes stop_codon:yes gene_type:complete
MHIPNTRDRQIFSRKDNIDRQIKYLDQQLEKIFNQAEDLIADGKEFDKYLEGGWDEQHYLDISIFLEQKMKILGFYDSIITARKMLEAAKDKNVRRV